MNHEPDEFAYRMRQLLNAGTEQLDPRITRRLHQARQGALAQMRAEPPTGLRSRPAQALAAALPHLRVFAALLALTLGAIGTYYWNQWEEATANEEIDSALLADELPPDAYLDRGFQAWLERSSPQSPR